jgi:hypothetical protein
MALLYDNADAGFSAAYFPGWVRIAGPQEQVDRFVAQLTSWRVIYRWVFDSEGARMAVVRVERHV